MTCRKSAKPDTSSASDKRLPVQCSVRARLTWNRRTAAEPCLECAVERGRYHVGYVCDNTTVCLWCTTVCAKPSWACLCSHTVVSIYFATVEGPTYTLGHFGLDTVVPDWVHNNHYCIHSIRYHFVCDTTVCAIPVTVYAIPPPSLLGTGRPQAQLATSLPLRCH